MEHYAWKYLKKKLSTPESITRKNILENKGRIKIYRTILMPSQSKSQQFNFLVYLLNTLCVCENWEDGFKKSYGNAEPSTVKTILKKNKARVLILSYIRTYHKSIVIKGTCYWCKDKQTDQWNKIQSSEIDPDMYGHLIHNKDNTEKRMIFLINDAE